MFTSVICLAESFVIVWLFCVARRADGLRMLALERQLRLYRDKREPRRQATRWERLLFVVWSKLTPDWRERCFAFTPRTVMRWKKNWVRHLVLKRQNQVGRPKLNEAMRELIRRIARENPLWGPGRIRRELAKLGLHVSRNTVRRYIAQVRGPFPRGDQRWRNVIRNHAGATLAMDFAVDYFPTLTGKLRRVWILALMEVGSRTILRLQATEHPSREWIANQLREAIPSDHSYRFVVHDNDQLLSGIEKTFGNFGIRSLRTPYRSPRANAYAERFIGTLRRELLDWIWPLGLRHLNRMLARYATYYNECRPHMGLDGSVPQPPPEPSLVAAERHALPDDVNVASMSHLGGLHHEYRLEARRAA